MPTTGSGLGLFPFGLGAPATAPDAPTGGPVIARYINPSTKDYELDATTGQLAGMPPVRQRVLLVLATVKKSSSVLRNLGIETPPVINETFEAVMKAEIRDAFTQMTDEDRVIRIRDILITEEGVSGRVFVVVAYTDLTLPEGAESRNDTVEAPLT